MNSPSVHGKRWRPSRYACFAKTQAGGVILDLKNADFIGLNTTAAEIYEQLISGVPRELIGIRGREEFPFSAGVQKGQLQTEADELTEFLLTRSLLEELHEPEFDLAVATKESSLRLPLLPPPAISTLPALLPLAERWEAAYTLQKIEEWLRQGKLLPLMRSLVALPAERQVTERDVSVKRLVHRVGLAAASKPFKAACLHQSLALCWMLRRRGVDAHVVIGCYTHPFFAHVWNECADRPIQWKAGMGPYADRETLRATSRIFHSKQLTQEGKYECSLRRLR